MQALWKLRQSQPEYSSSHRWQLLRWMHPTVELSIQLQRLSVVVSKSNRQSNHLVLLRQQHRDFRQITYIILNQLHEYSFFSNRFPFRFSGDSTQELTLQPAMFLNNPTILQWKIEFTLTAITPTNGIATGLSSMIILVNQLPYGGSCSVSPTTGITFNTTFIFSCTNWDDHDGEVASYSFYGNICLV